MLGTYPATGDIPAKEPIIVMVFYFLSNDNLSVHAYLFLLHCSSSMWAFCI